METSRVRPDCTRAAAGKEWPYLTLYRWSHTLRIGPAMPRKKISTTVYITPEQSDRLKLLHDRTKVPVAEYIQQGIDLVLQKYRGDLPGQLTLDDVGSKK